MTDDLVYPVPDDVSLVPLMRAFLSAERTLHAFVLENFEALETSGHEFDVLATLGDTAGMTFKDVTKKLFCSGPSTTRLIARMETEGLVQWVKSERDGREKIVSLTPAGQARYEQTFLPHVRAIRRRLAGLTQAEQQELGRLLEKFSRAFGPLPSESV